MQSYKLCAVGALMVMLGVGVACTDETVTIVETDTVAVIVKPGPDVEGGFLGYYDAESGQTNCGNCHAGFQTRWSETAHAGAYATLEGSGSAQPFCYGCHTVNEVGNSYADAGVAGGYNVEADSAYYDVQCESCHGPGADHPTAAAPGPLAQIQVDLTANVEKSCAGCHAGTHHPFVEQWAQSRHSRATPDVVSEHEPGESCMSCHEGRGALDAWGIKNNYLERDEYFNAWNPATAIGTTCAVCHDPHSTANSAQLRFPVASRDENVNLCMQCHNRRSTPSAGGSRASTPHAPQGAMILGTAGYWPSGFGFDTSLIVSTHGSEANERLCAGCHVFPSPFTDLVTGEVINSVGHLFRPIPCLVDGVPVGDNNCSYDPAGAGTVRTFVSCTQAGCHTGGENVAASALAVARVRIEQLADALWDDVDGDSALDATDAGYLATVLATMPNEFCPAVSTGLGCPPPTPPGDVVTPAEGALFNVRMVAENRYGLTADRSKSVHNPFLAEALLRANIDEMQTYYGLPAPPPAVARILSEPLLNMPGREFPRLRAKLSTEE